MELRSRKSCSRWTGHQIRRLALSRRTPHLGLVINGTRRRVSLHLLDFTGATGVREMPTQISATRTTAQHTSKPMCRALCAVLVTLDDSDSQCRDHDRCKQTTGTALRSAPPKKLKHVSLLDHQE